ncbi:MAG TPA: glycerol-3-phosphate acyltransferase [Ruminococcaceae bacterium]|nr:glycerol-3-phosphate acyltransferase [Oscillospiraceae bacterium]
MTAVLIISAAVSYLSGGINGAIILSRLVYHDDIRKYGSNNPGFTNFKRVYGNNAVSWSVILIDALKTVLPVLATAIVMNALYGQWQLGAQFSGLFCMIGHCFPVWYGFKGGKAFITGFATIWFVDWRMTLIAMAVFFALLFTLKYMSVASCCAAAVCPVALAFLGVSDVWVEILAIAAAALVICRHYPNFIKLARGTESKFTLRGK